MYYLPYLAAIVLVEDENAMIYSEIEGCKGNSGAVEGSCCREVPGIQSASDREIGINGRRV